MCHIFSCSFVYEIRTFQHFIYHRCGACVRSLYQLLNKVLTLTLFMKPASPVCLIFQDEIAPPEINELLAKCRESYSRQQVKQLEMIVLMVTSFDLMAPTVQQFLEYFASYCLATYAEDEEHRQRLRYLCVLC